jgi:hypothetical protein
MGRSCWPRSSSLTTAMPYGRLGASKHGGARLADAVAVHYTLTMTADTIREMLARDPFEPFRIVTSAGESFIIRDPHTVALLKSEVFIARPKSDRRTFIPLLHVVTVETVGNGHTGRRKRKA